MRVLTIGATGRFGGLVVPALVGKGLQVRALVHDPDKAEQLANTGVAETVRGDLRDSDSMRAALDGVDGVFLILPAFAPDTIELGTTLVHAAEAAGVQRVVFSGVYHPMRQGLAEMFDAYTAYGFHGGNNLVLTSILGRAPRTLDTFFAELAH